MLDQKTFDEARSANKRLNCQIAIAEKFGEMALAVSRCDADASRIMKLAAEICFLERERAAVIVETYPGWPPGSKKELEDVILGNTRYAI